jgi:DNA-binding response OmpR family regulator
MLRLCLIAEYDPWEIELLTLYTEQLGYKVVKAYNSNDILKTLKTTRPEIIVIAHNLPGSPPLADLIRQIREELNAYQIPIIVTYWPDATPPLLDYPSEIIYLPKPITLEAFSKAHLTLG